MRNPIRVSAKMRSKDTAAAAAAYIDSGFKIVMLFGIDDEGKCTCGKQNCSSPGKHPHGRFFKRGVDDATDDIAAVQKVLKADPQANIALALHGLTVIDCDGPKGERLMEKLSLSPTAMVKTRRGKHAYFSGELSFGTKKAAQLDFLSGESRYAVVPPSRHRGGGRYEWARHPDSLAHMDRKLERAIENLVGGKVASAAKTNSSQKAVSAGSRNSTLASIAGYFRMRGFAAGQLIAVLTAVNSIACRPPLDKQEVERIATSIGSYASDDEETFMSLADVEATNVEFIVHPYVVQGALTVIDGHMGQGKSTFTAALAAAITTGKAPAFLTPIKGGGVLFLSAEDDAARVLRPRLEANGADIEKIRFQNKPFTLNDEGLMRLKEEIDANKPLVVFIDPVIAYMDVGTDNNNANDVTRLMGGLDYIARENDIAIVLVRHLRKARAETAMHQGIGSIALSARVRSGLILGIHPHNSDLRAIVHAKSNYAKEGPAIVFEMVSDGDRSPPTIEWREIDPTITVEDLMPKSDGDRGRPNIERQDAQAFLKRELQPGPVKKTTLLKRAADASISAATLRRAADGIGVQKTRKNGEGYWALP